MLSFLGWVLFSILLLLAVPLQVLGLPGTWVLVADALFLRLFAGPQWLETSTLVALGAMALVGELMELSAAVKGARSGPQIRGAAVASILGALAGGLLGAPILFGLGAIPGMALGAWVAVFILALALGTGPGAASRAALGALTGRLKGTVYKMAVCVAMLAVIAASLVW
ncbi:MAG: DUF456 family protein [bacterium]|nr:MAG: DUF456 family protein [bacterium]